MKQDQAATAAYEISEPGCLTRLQRMIARSEEDRCAVQLYILRIGDHADVEMMGRFQRSQKRSSHVLVVVAAAREQHKDRDSFVHLSDFTMVGSSDPAQNLQRLIGSARPREARRPAPALLAELLPERLVRQQALKRGGD